MTIHSASALKVVASRVCVRQDDAPTTTPGGLLIPAEHQERPFQGRVVSAGRTSGLSEGDHVIFGRHSAEQTFEIEGVPHFVMKGEEIIARLHPPPSPRPDPTPSAR